MGKMLKWEWLQKTWRKTWRNFKSSKNFLVNSKGLPNGISKNNLENARYGHVDMVQIVNKIKT